MNAPRVVLVTRRFWPLLGAAESSMANLACGLAELGARPLVLTAQYDKSWPGEVVHREVPVVRLPHPPAQFWGPYRYLGALSRWLQAHRDEIDVACVSSLGYDAYTTMGALAGSRVKVVLRAERSGPAGDVQRQRRASFGARVRRRCMRARAVVAPLETVRQELLAAGYATDRVRLIANGVPLPPPRDLAHHEAARTSLAEAHPVLALPEGAPLVVAVGRLTEANGFFDLVDAWPAVRRRWPHARLWLVGQGPAAETIWKRIERRELKSDVVLTGLFDGLDDVLLAADLFVRPAIVEGAPLALLEAMAAELPIVATDLSATREFVSSSKQALLVPPHNPVALSAAIEQLLVDRALARNLASAARRLAEERFSLERMARGHLDLFDSLD